MDINEIRQHFEADKYMLMTGVIIEDAGPDWCRCSLKVQPQHMNAGGAVQGGAIYTLADSAFAVACNMRHLSEGDGKLTVSQSASISYITAGKAGSTLFAEAKKAGGGKRTSVYKIDVTDQDGTIIATMTGNGFTIELR
jgi:acyl-CoA thioesterase